MDKNTDRGQFVKDRNGCIGAIIVLIIVLGIMFVLYKVAWTSVVAKTIIGILCILALLVAGAAISCYFDYQEARKREQIEIETREQESELTDIDPSKVSLRAEKLYRVNQRELMRYYEMNISQTKFLSKLGCVTILIGFIIVAVSIFIYHTDCSDNFSLLVGSVSGILIDFIGIVFINMYNKNVEASIKFHSKFVDSNSLLLANAIASKIDDSKVREETLASISKGIISNNFK